ncbi:uncharacterized protein LOC125231456 isoform X2 [Leguminivora glycinivorella]|uniref:uncharacterized protein LOC125231456 isoform X2 n=1 Tax=Leguminivora glycinivorella TaxID=1035111 RepID=UPI0020101191|nr:uncharacterized protein LOC125231456 isoform X2 [Leguminivora glycinivorella]
MFILITFFVSHTVFVNAYHGEVRDTPSYSPTNDLGRTTPIGAFPNHEIEINVEKSQDAPLQVPLKYMEWLNANPNLQAARRSIARSGEKNDVSTTTVPTTTTVTTTTPTSMSTTTMRYMSDQETFQTMGNAMYNQKRPLYMEDLIQALEDFEKKRKQDDLVTSNRIDLTTEDGNRPLVKKDLWDLQNILSNRDCKERRSSTGEGIKDFNDVINLINKGVKVQLEVTTPAGGDPNMNWVPIKIPKNT